MRISLEVNHSASLLEQVVYQYAATQATPSNTMGHLLTGMVRAMCEVGKSDAEFMLQNVIPGLIDATEKVIAAEIGEWGASCPSATEAVRFAKEQIALKTK